MNLLLNLLCTQSIYKTLTLSLNCSVVVSFCSTVLTVVVAPTHVYFLGGWGYCGPSLWPYFTQYLRSDFQHLSPPPPPPCELYSTHSHRKTVHNSWGGGRPHKNWNTGEEGLISRKCSPRTLHHTCKPVRSLDWLFNSVGSAMI